MLRISKLKKIYISGGAEVRAVNGIDMEITKGQFVSIIGRSGCGKSTFLSLIGALDKPTSGSIEFENENITRLSDKQLIKYRREKIGFIFQDYSLVPNLNALQNVMLPMEFAGVNPSQRLERAAQLLKEVGITQEKFNRKPKRLSGGEQQRVAIARAIANKPKLLLADEPTGNLDSETGTMILQLLRSLTTSEGTTIIMVTHDNEIAGQTDITYRLRDGKVVSSRA